MSEKKVVARTTAIALAVLCIVVLIGAVGAVIYYNQTVDNNNKTIDSQNTAYAALQSQNSNYVNDHSHTNEDYESLKANYSDYVNSHSHTDSDYVSVQSNYDSVNSQYSQYQSSHSYTNTAYNSLSTQNSNLQTWLNGNVSLLSSANSQINSLTTQNSNLQTELNGNVTALSNANSQISLLNAPNLVQVNLVGSDSRPLLGTDNFVVTGYECNVGTNPAYNSEIHVVAYQGSVVAIDTYITLGTILGHGWHTTNSQVSYVGNALTSWNLTLIWTSS